ncbi:MAG: hypothetical protein ACR2RE_20855 [Geminicoccaceae bacterium]
MASDPMTRRPTVFVQLMLLLLITPALMACEAPVAGNQGEWRSAVNKPESEDKRQTGSIRVGDDLVMIPAGVDEDGCEMFKPRSANRVVKTAIHYRQADGSFGIARDPAICRVDMTSIGSDEEGCERYHAIPRNAGLPPLAEEIVYYKAADGRYLARKPRDGCA